MATVAPKPLASESLRCTTSFRHFVHEFWDEIPGTAPLCWNWHLDVICEELQRIAMRVYQGLPNTHDTVINVSPGTSKSSLCSILFQAWVWTFFPKARHLTASHTDTLCLDLANKSRTVIRSDKYRELFPHVRLAPGQNAKGYYQNTHGGDRLTCTVAGKSPMGFHAHYLLCFPGDTLIATNRGQLPIGEVVESRLPVKVLGYDHIANRTVWRDIEEHERSPGRQLVTITFGGGRQLEATSDHPVYVMGRGYVEAESLNPGDMAIESDDTGTTGDITVVSVGRSHRRPKTVYNVRVADVHNYFANGVLVHNCDDPLDPKKAVSEAELRSAQYFFDAVLPSRKVDKAVSTSFLVMQRLHDDDPTGHLLKRSRRPGTTPIRHVCLPAELTADVHPPELAERYRDGLMDPVRLSRSVLQEARANMGEYAYAGQYLQRPVPLTGGLFREAYFVLRAKAAPLESTRVRFWDRAASAGSGCNTAGVLMARAKNGAYYVEHVVAGQWAPDERNDVMLTTAQRDRARYGRHEPRILVEREGGSSGRDAFLAIVRHLSGFPVFEEAVTGDKVTRAEPWSSQCAARNVWIVDDGTWDVAAYINEHCLFPRATLKDRVDASSGACNYLARITDRASRPPLRSYRIGARKGEFRIVLCGPHDTPALDLPWLRLCLHDPGSPSPADTAQMVSLLATCELSFADLDVSALQSAWNEPVPGYDKPPAELVMNRDHARRLWAFLVRQQKEGVPVLVIADSNDDRSTSVAMAYCHATGRDPSKVVCRLGEDAWKPPEVPPSRHVYETVKLGQSLVL